MASRESASGSRGAGRRWVLLIILCLGQLMIVLDINAVNVALPVIQHELHFSQSSLAWVINAYLLTFGGLLLLAGRLGDLVGRTEVFLVGLCAFALSSLACGLARSSDVLVAGRFVQGASAAMIAAMVLGIISPMFPEPKDRTKAFSIFAFVTVGGVSLGLVLGGVVTDLLGWHWIFFINVPIGAATLVAGKRLLSRQPGLGVREGADLLGAVLVTGAPVLAVYGVIDAGSSGWSSPGTIGPLVGSVVLANVFVWVERRGRTPLIPLRVFRHRNLAAAVVVRALFAMGTYALNAFGALYLEHVLGYSPLRTGLAFFPLSGTICVVSLAVIPRLARRVGLKTLTVVGLLLVTAGIPILYRVSLHSGFVVDILPTMLFVGVGAGLMFAPSTSIAMSDVEPTEAGIASGLANVAMYLGAAISVAILATVSTSHTHQLLREHETLKAALTGGYRTAFLIAAGFEAVSLLAAILLLRPPGANVVRVAAVEEEPAVVH